jgi:hypothetical protein
MNEADKIAREKTYIGPAIDIAIRIGVIASSFNSTLLHYSKALYLSGDVGNHPCYYIIPCL